MYFTAFAVATFFSCSKNELQTPATVSERDIAPVAAASTTINPNLIYQEDFEQSSFFPLSGSGINLTEGIENCNNKSTDPNGPEPWTLSNGYSPAFQGSKSAHFEVRKDQPLVGSSQRIRSEVTIIKGDADARFTPDAWYSYSVFVPAKGGEPDYRLSMNQWFEDGSDELTTRMDNGYIYLELQNSGKTFRWDLFSTFENTSATNKGFTLYPVDEWHEFVFHINHSLNSDGFIEVYKDGVKIHEYHGPTIHLKMPKWKIGLYASSNMTLTRIIYFDNVRVGKKGATLADMVSGSTPPPPPTPNTPPTANAGSDVSVTLPVTTATLSGSGTDADGSIAGYAWKKVSGPSGGTISSASSASTTISSLVAGVYVYQLTVTDNLGATATDDVQVTVKSATNAAPVVNAGSDQTITLPTSSVTLKGTATDSDGTIASVQWTKVSGSSYTISNATALAPVISGLVAGTYVFRLTATDNSGTSSSDDIQVTVNPAPVTTTNVAVTSMVFINAATEAETVTITNGGTYSLKQLGITKMNIKANSGSLTSSVKFELTGALVKTVTDKAAPFALMGDDGKGNYYYGAWNPPAAGTYTLKATPYDALKLAGTPLTVTFTITN